MTILQSLKKESTFATLFYNIITFGVYGGFYMKRQTDILNPHVDDNKKISTNEMNAYIVFATVSAFISFILMLSDHSESYESLDKFITFCQGVWFIVWTFRWRTMFYTILGAKAYYPAFKLNGFVLFLFGLYYINYKINEISSFTEETTLVEQTNS